MRRDMTEEQRLIEKLAARQRALELALSTAGNEPPDTTVKRAKTYLDFLMEDFKAKAAG